MDSKPKEHRSAGEIDEDTVAWKRSRRVSFAEITAVHVFDRDEDFETPPDSNPEGSKPAAEREALGFQGDHSDNDDSKDSKTSPSAREEEEDDDEDEQERFVRYMDLSSSPGSAVGSVASNDDDNFFGPVSTSFIKSGRLSEAGMSDDENHDITLDSTAFSLHFRNIAPSDDRSANSAGSLRTPTGDSVPTDPGGFMISKGFKKVSKLSDGRMSGSAGDSNNMSLVVENPNRYDYGKISPTLEALLAQVNQCIQPNTPFSDSRTVTSKHDIDEVSVVKDSGEDETRIGNEDAPGDAAHDTCSDPHLLEGFSVGIDVEQYGNGISSPNRKASLSIGTSTFKKTQGTSPPKVNDDRRNAHEASPSGIMDANAQNPDMLSHPYRKSPNNMNLPSGHSHQDFFRNQESVIKHYSNSSYESMPTVPALANVDGQQQLLEYEYGIHTPKNDVSPLQSPLLGSASSLRAKQQQLFLDPHVQAQRKLMHSPARELPEYGMHTPKNAVLPVQPPLQGSVSSICAKQQELFLDLAVQPQRKLIHSPSREESEYVMHTPKNAVSPLQPPLQGSVSSLRAKRQQLFLNPVVQSQTNLMHSPAIEEPPSSLKMDLMRHGERISAIKNLISKSKILKSPALVDARPALSGMDHLSLEHKGTSDKMNDDPNIGHTGVSFINTEDKSRNVAQQARGHETSLELSHSGIQNANNANVYTHHEKNQVIGDTVKLTRGIPPFQLSQSEINKKQNLLIAGNPTEHASTPHVHGSSLEHAILNLKESSQVLDTTPKAISSPIQMPKEKLSAFQEGYLTPGANRTIGPSSLLGENGLRSSISFTIPSSDKVRKLQNPKELKKNDIPLYNSQKETEISMNFHLGSQKGNIEMKKYSTNMKDKVFVRETTAASNEPAFEDAYKETATVNKSMECLAEENIQSPKQKTNNDNNILHSFNLVDQVSSKPTQYPKLHDHDINYQDLQSVRRSISIQDDIIGRKRGIEQILLVDKDSVSEISRIQKSPKLLPKFAGSNSGISSEHHMESNNKAHVIGDQAPQKHWTNILAMVSEATKQLFSPSIYQLKSRELDILEDILGELQTARKYERLRTSLRNHDFLSDLHQKRVSEARSLLDKLVYEKAKLQLKRVKLDKLYNKAQICQSRSQECDKLKSIYSQFLGARAVQTQDSLLCTVSVNSNSRNQEEYNRVTSMRQELEMLDQKVKRLMKSFKVSCKIKGNMSSDEIIKVINDHLETRNRCRLIQQDLQLWKLSEVMKKNGQCDIVLNYCNLLFQRFTINSDSVSSIVANNLLNNASIEKNFPNINACIAFEFVFKAKGDHKLASSKHFQQETLETSLLLGTLLDVLEEVLVSRMELWNLTSSTFHSQTSGQLELQLCFLSFKSSRKVTLCLDMTVLNCAVYPSEPSEFQIRVSKAETTLPSTISDEIMSAIQSLHGGRSMIVRLCRSITQVVQASS